MLTFTRYTERNQKFNIPCAVVHLSTYMSTDNFQVSAFYDLIQFDALITELLISLNHSVLFFSSNPTMWRIRSKTEWR